MVVALFLVSLAMIVGGSMAAVFGWDIVLNERGWVMVIAGSVVAASGFLMLGLAAIVVRLGRIRRILALIHDRIGRGEPGLSDHAALDPLVAIPPAVAATGEARDDGMDEVRPPLPAFMQPRDAEPELDLPPPEPRKPEIPAEPAKEAAAAAEPPP